MKNKLLQIVDYYGLLNQLKYIQTEYFELTEAILDREYDDCTHFEEIEKKYRYHIAEELADIMVMLKQFQYYYSIEDEDIDEIMKFKIDRQLERISKEQMENL